MSVGKVIKMHATINSAMQLFAFLFFFYIIFFRFFFFNIAQIVTCEWESWKWLLCFYVFPNYKIYKIFLFFGIQVSENAIMWFSVTAQQASSEKCLEMLYTRSLDRIHHYQSLVIGQEKISTNRKRLLVGW